MATTYSREHYANKTKTTGNPTDLWDLLQTTQAADSTTTITFTSTTAATVRVAPYRLNQSGATIPAVGAAASNVGWKIPVAVMNASNGEPRVIRAGQYTLPISVTTGTYALLATSPSYQTTGILYKISSAGVSTEIGRGTVTISVAATTTQVFTPLFTLATDLYIQPGETLQVEWLFRGNATANALNQVTNNTCTFNMGTQINLLPPTAIQTEATRSATETGTAMTDSTLRVQVSVRRTVGDQATGTDTAAREATLQRTASAAQSETLTAPFTATYPRVGTDAMAVPADGATRVSADYRRAGDSFPTVTDTAVRTQVDYRRAPQDAVTMDATAQKLVVYGRTARYDFVPGDAPLIDPTRQISGVVRDSAGQPYLGSATVYLVRDDNLVAAQTLSSSIDGSYVFWRNSYDTSTYYVVAFTDGALPREGVTERGLVPS